ncbi:MAG: hypothetical protein HFE63_01405 [Clostridiales bacterium]|nr:hypothetical protein [Clostridiales bacterium]
MPDDIKSATKLTSATKLMMWKERFSKAYSAYESTLKDIAKRDNAYNGEVEAKKLVSNEFEPDPKLHIRNIIAEMIEAEVDTAIPQPKVTAKRKEDELLAKLIEDMLRDELDRMPFEVINDWAERMCPIQGGCFYLCEWDNTQLSHSTVGENRVTTLNPKQVIPQAGIYSIDDMEYCFVLLPQTKEYIKRRYGVELADEDAEENPEVRTANGDSSSCEELVTQYIAYYRGEDGIGMYSWVLDTELCDFEDYQARKVKKCVECGSVIGGDKCEVCGSGKFEESSDDMENLTMPLQLFDGEVIEASPELPYPIPYYKPDVFPIVLQRNVTAFGRFLGNSDVELIYDQQVTTNRIEQRIIEKLLHGGSLITLPKDARIRTDNEVGKALMLDNPADKAMIDQYDLTCDVSKELTYLAQVYEEARQTIGITDSFQGRNDSTATSKVAKEFAARQSAGRLESKRQMKNYAYSKIFEILFKFRLAYADEPRPIRALDNHGDTIYEVFNRYDFLRRDEAGELYWNDDFTFSVDTSAPLASNREAMWQETRMNLESGAFGNPQELDTLILFWQKMELLHYPGAGETKQYLTMRQNEAMRQQQMQQQAQMKQQAAMAQQQEVMSRNGSMQLTGTDISNSSIGDNIDEQARQAAAAEVFGIDRIGNDRIGTV